MEMLKPPPPFSLVGEPGENYKKWKQRYQIYYTASGASNRLNDEGKIALFLHCLGEECLPIYNNFEFTEEQPQTVYQNVVTKFDEYFMPMCNETMARHLFFKRKMRESETLDEYITVLRTMAKDCNFGATTDSLIKDQIIRGLRKKNIVERLLKEVNLDLPMCIKLCKTYEVTEKQIKEFEFEESSSPHQINKINKRHNKEQENIKTNNQKQRTETRKNTYYERKVYNENKKKECQRCSYIHGFKCPAFNKQCMKCRKFGHFAKMCRNVVKVIQQEDEENFVLSVKHVDSVKKSELYESVQLQSKIIDFKLDTGSDCDVLPLKYVEQLKLRNKVVSKNSNLYNYDGSKINCVGVLPINGRLINNKIVNFEFHIVDCECVPVLGHSTISKLNLIERIFLRNIETSCYDNMIKDYKHLFDENIIGNLKGVEYKIRIKENSVETGQKLDRNRKYFSISKNPDRMSIQKTYDLYDNNIHENNMYVNNDLSENCNDQSVNSESKSCVEERKEDKSESRVCPENYITRKGRVVKKPSYLNDYC
ncbi:hypothetical protein ACJJTC_008798 [Scirpophaga incertulas]